MNESTMPEKSIDWKLALQLTNGNRALAREMLELLVQELPKNRQEIAKTYDMKDIRGLRELIHKIYGGTCYCGVPKLKPLLIDIEDRLATYQLIGIEARLRQLDQEIVQILEEAPAALAKDF